MSDEYGGLSNEIRPTGLLEPRPTTHGPKSRDRGDNPNCRAFNALWVVEPASESCRGVRKMSEAAKVYGDYFRMLDRRTMRLVEWNIVVERRLDYGTLG